MTRKPKILAFSGSLREGAYSKRVLKTAIRGAQQAGADVTSIDLCDYPLPVYNPDDEAAHGFHENARKLQALLVQHDAFLIASPEHNGSITAALKNMIDWTSRKGDTYERSEVFPGKFAAMVAASPGSSGGVRSLLHLRGVLTSVGVHVLPTEVAISNVESRFAGDGDEIVDERMKQRLEKLGAALVEILRRTTPRDPR
jgi:chromate reductase